MGGFPRFTGGFVELMNVPFIPVMIGLFAASEAFRSMEQNQQIRQGAKVAIGSLLLPRQTLRRIALTILRSSGLGVFIGMIPGAGADIAAFVAYNETRRFSKTPENFGKGEIKAVASCEAGANGCTGGALLPMLTLGSRRCGNRHHAGRVNVTGNATGPADVYRPRRYGLYTVCRHDLLLLHATSSWTALFESHR